MGTYDIYRTVTHFLTVEADGEDKALKKGFDKFQEEDGIYDSTDYIVTQITGEEE
jgi:hypothetical protein